MRRWVIKLYFNNETPHLSSVTLKDVSNFIKTSKAKNGGVKIHKTLPVEAWLLDIALSKAINMEQLLINATITQGAVNE